MIIAPEQKYAFFNIDQRMQQPAFPGLDASTGSYEFKIGMPFWFADLGSDILGCTLSFTIVRTLHHM